MTLDIATKRNHVHSHVNGNGNGYYQHQKQQQQQQIVQKQAIEHEHGDVQPVLRGFGAIAAPDSLLRCRNPIRDVLESLPPPEKLASSNGKAVIALGQGDPSAFNYLHAPEAAEKALLDAITCRKYNGYTHSAGSPECRRAVAEYHSQGSLPHYTLDDVIITVGCTQAIQFCIAALALPGSNVLLPRPGFPLYETFCSYYDVEVRHYDLLPDQDWEIDLDSLEDLADGNTIAILICNPSNPCGTAYSSEHLCKVIEKVEHMKIPIISDEVYANIVFGGDKFSPVATLAPKVPVLTVGGLSKRWLVPGWRLGWILISDPLKVLAKAKVVEALTKLAQMTVNTSTIVQAAVPSILQNTPEEFFKNSLHLLQQGADLCCRRIEKINGLECPSRPKGAMFIMVKINLSLFTDLHSDIEFASALAKEESVIVLPGTAFGTPSWVRIIFAAPSSLLEEAWDRIEAFCKRHCQNDAFIMC